MNASPAASQRPYSRRFAVATAALAVVVAIAAILTWQLIGHDAPRDFSSFAPTKDDPVERAQEIADNVSARYVTASGQPIVRITAGEDDTSAAPGATQVVGMDSAPPGVVAFEEGNILFFRLCSTDPDCGATTSGIDRTLLATILAREAHELALYGLKYLDGPAFVMVLLPPGFIEVPPGANPVPKAVHFYRRKDLRAELDRPIDETLPGPAPTPETLSPQEQTAIETAAAGTRFAMQAGPDPTNTFRIYNLTPL